ncbi:hypothetical protein [Pendulispora albinea]|uniref:Uncharacterized protein n=1 Tax=Pendulispora albinea TaxID=2741071 RepID=A0ABZ2LNW4_9BACT
MFSKLLHERSPWAIAAGIGGVVLVGLAVRSHVGRGILATLAALSAARWTTRRLLEPPHVPTAPPPPQLTSS